MKITWETNDIIAGRRAGKSDRVEVWIIGYDPNTPPGKPKWALISTEDGMISRRGLTKEQLASHLNSSGDYPVELFPMNKRAAGKA